MAKFDSFRKKLQSKRNDLPDDLADGLDLTMSVARFWQPHAGYGWLTCFSLEGVRPSGRASVVTVGRDWGGGC
jgi:hypothetical protein